MTTQTITEVEEIEFAIQGSRKHNEIVTVIVPNMQAARDYLSAKYDAGHNADERGGVSGYDIWATEGDWRLFLREAACE